MAAGNLLERLAALASRLFPAGAALALLLPAFGPLLDHHFAERQPTHVHVYLASSWGSSAGGVHGGQASTDHVHPFQRQGHYDHDHSHTAPDHGVVYFASHDGTGPAFLDVTTSVTKPAQPLPEPEANAANFGVADAQALPPGASVSPPTQPPRA